MELEELKSMHCSSEKLALARHSTEIAEIEQLQKWNNEQNESCADRFIPDVLVAEEHDLFTLLTGNAKAGFDARYKAATSLDDKARL